LQVLGVLCLKEKKRKRKTKHGEVNTVKCTHSRVRCGIPYQIQLR
jgi:hypothetical protein